VEVRVLFSAPYQKLQRRPRSIRGFFVGALGRCSTRRAWKFLPLALLAAVVGATPAIAAESLAGRAHAADGDSLEIDGARVRLWGVDAPEFRQTCRRGGQRWACGQDALKALRDHLEGRTVRCEVVDTDKHARKVARCTLAGRSVNEWLVREGWALDYGRYSGGRYAQAQAAAKAARRGLWSGEFEAPERYRRTQPR
jgi:endonuclease YncB( thermonuclease family)